MSRYTRFDRSLITLRDLEQRGHDLAPAQCRALEPPAVPYQAEGWQALIEAVVAARQAGRPVIWMMGAHPIKLGLNRYLIDLIERGWLTHLATNGAGMIHDFELAWGQGTSEDVSRWIRVGQFGLWRETGLLNDIVAEGARRDEGLGEAVGRFIVERSLPRHDLSLAAAGWRKGIPVTCHVSIGSDIIHAHANCDGAAFGATSLTDFLIFARAIQDLEGGVFLNVGSAVTGPEVYLKALSMARNVARRQGQAICHFTTSVWDLPTLPETYRQGPPDKAHPMYYYRPWKTILVRTVADGGTSYYFNGDHAQTIPTLWHHLATRAVSAPAAPTRAA